MAMREPEPVTTYVDLDSLYDVRMVILKWIAPHVAYDVVQDKSYFVRVKDIFKTDYITLTYDHIEPFYKKRNKLFLKQAFPTPIYDLLEFDVRRHLTDLKEGNCTEQYRVILNTYPYRLNDEEKENLRTSITSKMVVPILCDVIYMHPSGLTGKYIHEKNIQRYFIRDLYAWINSINIRDFREYPVFERTLLTPKIVNTSGLEARSMTTKFFEDLKSTLTPYGDVEFLESYAFSINYVDLPKRKKENDKSTE